MNWRSISGKNTKQVLQSGITELESKVLAINTAVSSINAPNYFWFTAPTLSGIETTTSATIFNPIPWSMATLLTLIPLLGCGHAQPQGYGHLYSVFTVRTTLEILHGASSTIAH